MTLDRWTDLVLWLALVWVVPETVAEAGARRGRGPQDRVWRGYALTGAGVLGVLLTLLGFWLAELVGAS